MSQKQQDSNPGGRSVLLFRLCSLSPQYPCVGFLSKPTPLTRRPEPLLCLGGGGSVWVLWRCGSEECKVDGPSKGSPVGPSEGGVGCSREGLVGALTSESLSSVLLTDGGFTVRGHHHGSYKDGAWALVADKTCREGHREGWWSLDVALLPLWVDPGPPLASLSTQPTPCISLLSPGTGASLGAGRLSLTHEVFLFPLILIPIKS